MRRKMVAGNWKMYGSRSSVDSLVQGIKQSAQAFSNVDIVVFPSFVFMQQVENLLAHTAVALGWSESYLGNQGAFTRGSFRSHVDGFWLQVC